MFISQMREKVQQDAQTSPNPQLRFSEAPLCTSLLSNDSATAVGYSLFIISSLLTLNSPLILFQGASSNSASHNSLTPSSFSCSPKESAVLVSAHNLLKHEHHKWSIEYLMCS